MFYNQNGISKDKEKKLDIEKVEKEFNYIIQLLKKEQDFSGQLIINSKTDNERNFEMISINGISDQNMEGIQIRFRIYKNRIEIPLLYLINTRKGTGSRMVEWFLNYAKNKDLQKVIFKNIEKSNVISMSFFSKFDKGKFTPSYDTENEYLDYVIELI